MSRKWYTFPARARVYTKCNISITYWNNLIQHRDKPLINKAVAGLYPPGSTIKLLSAISALENDVFNPKTTIRCQGYIELYGEKYHCWKKKGHGFVNMREGMKQSCDVYFYEVARILGIDRLAETARKFGLGKPVLKDLFITNNQAQTNGGGLYHSWNGTDFSELIVTNNQAGGNGGGLWLMGSQNNSNLVNILVCNNSAVGWGGGIYLSLIHI